MASLLFRSTRFQSCRLVLTFLGLLALLREFRIIYFNNPACTFRISQQTYRQHHQFISDTTPRQPSLEDDDEPVLFFNYTQRGAALLRPSKIAARNEQQHDHWKHLTFLQHIPKTGGTSLYDLLTRYNRAMNKSNTSASPINSDVKFENWFVDRIPNSTWFQRKFARRPCDVVMVETEFFSTLWRNETTNTTTVTIDSSNNNYHQFELATFTLIRPPEHHVVSQYFHCTESIYAYHSRHMPKSLDAWLEFWIQVQKGNPLVSDLASHEDEKDIFMYEPYACYNPMDMQTRFVQGLVSPQQLQTQFWAVGLTDRLQKSSCLFAVRLFGLVPQECNCSKTPTINRVDRVDHNVRHHGDKYNLTRSQRDQIDSLTKRDQRLYRNAVRVFEQNVQQAEQEFQVTLCGE